MRLDLHREIGGWRLKQQVVQVWGFYQKKTVGCLLVGTVLLTTGCATPGGNTGVLTAEFGQTLRSVDTLMRQQAAAERRQQEAERHRQWFNSLSPEQQATYRAQQ
jgi:hypothetical protein